MKKKEQLTIIATGKDKNRNYVSVTDEYIIKNIEKSVHKFAYNIGLIYHRAYTRQILLMENEK